MYKSSGSKPGEKPENGVRATLAVALDVVNGQWVYKNRVLKYHH
jgi:hypothetical protein